MTSELRTDQEKEQRLVRRSIFRLTRLYRAATLEKLIVLLECAKDGLMIGYHRSLHAPNGYSVRCRMLTAEITRRATRINPKQVHRTQSLLNRSARAQKPAPGSEHR